MIGYTSGGRLPLPPLTPPFTPPEPLPIVERDNFSSRELRRKLKDTWDS